MSTGRLPDFGIRFYQGLGGGSSWLEEINSSSSCVGREIAPPDHKSSGCLPNFGIRLHQGLSGGSSKLEAINSSSSCVGTGTACCAGVNHPSLVVCVVSAP